MRYIFFLILLVALASCTKRGGECMPPPPSISFRFVDNNNKDLLATGGISQSDITIHDETGKSCQYLVQGTDTIKTLRVYDLNDGNHTYKLTASDKSVDFSMNIANGECGSYIKEEKIIKPSSFSKDQRGFYVIKFP